MNRFHLHLVSDATGDTLAAVAKAAEVQFEGVEALHHTWSMIRTKPQMERVLAGIASAPGLVLFTLVHPELREEIEEGCRKIGVPYVAVLDPVFAALSAYLGARHQAEPGRQHTLDSDYFRRIEAMTFCLNHDDGQGLDDIHRADVVLVGVSRTSKTPTCIYLANRGIRAANVPIVPNMAAPEQVENLTKPLVVGLIASPDRLAQVRRNRLLALNQAPETGYVEIDSIKDEIAAARRLFARHDWPVIDVTRRSIEETAAAVLSLYERRREAAGEKAKA
ncbi:MAG: kinase/pyrophosphorylase [Alphaproteobacteria bacterium]|nr:kinase/pyrophosphorylase [Alphaproteobacteria bacterium]